MSKQKHRLLILSLTAFFIFLVASGSVHLKKAQADVGQQPLQEETNISGWAWIGNAQEGSVLPHLGWISLNCYNYFGVSGVQSQCATGGSGQSDYGLKIDPVTGDMSGYLWGAVVDDSEATTGIGWIDFAPAPLQFYPTEVQMSGPTAGQISGWARMISLQEAGENLGLDDWGWILLGPDPDLSRPWGVNINFGYENCFANNDPCPLWGYAWSGGNVKNDPTPPPGYNDNTTTGLGWIYFGEQNDPENALAWYNPDPDSHEFTGWAWVGNSDKTSLPTEANVGWISLNSDNGGAGGGNYQVTLNPATGEISGYAWAGNTERGVPPIGWIDFAPTRYPSWPDFSAKFFQTNPDPVYDPHDPTITLYDYDAGDIAGWARIITLQTAGEDAGMRNWGWIKLHATQDEIDNRIDYGLSIDFENGTFCPTTLPPAHGCYAWSGGGTVAVNIYDNNVGLGWISFESTYTGLPGFTTPPTYVAPYLKTESGDIYAKEGLGVTPYTFKPPKIPLFDPTNPEYHQEYNATYLIQSGGDIINFISEEAQQEPRFEIYEYLGPFSPPLATNRYTNVMGKLDVVGLTNYEITDPDRLNKFGYTVNKYVGNWNSGGTGGIWEDNTAELNNQIWNITGNLTIPIDEPLEIQQGELVNNAIAAGTVVVDGDLLINSDISYEVTSDLTDIKQIPSVAWIVKGDVIVDPAVEEIVGTFVAVGTKQEQSPDLVDGTFHTCLSTTVTPPTCDSNNVLTVSGIIIANDIKLERTGIGSLDNIQPAEKVTYDGRVIVNTPPGLSDFAAVLPVLREVAPIEEVSP